MTETNRWCEVLGIARPSLEAVATHAEANTFSLLIVALLERGEPMTLPEVAARFEAAGIADAAAAARALSRCRPARSPVYREGEHYALIATDDELDLWTFRLGLRPARWAPLPLRPEPPPLPGPDTPLTRSELDEAFNKVSITSWSPRRLAVAVLDAEDGPMAPADALAAIAGRTAWFRGRLDDWLASVRHSAVQMLPDGRWTLIDRQHPDVVGARKAVRQRVAAERARTANRPDPEAHAARTVEVQKARDARVARLAEMSRALLVTYPPSRPVAAVLVEIEGPTMTSYTADDFDALRRRLATFEAIAAVDARTTVRALGLDPDAYVLHELSPPQKTKRLSAGGRVLQVTLPLLIRGSCGLERPLGDPEKLAAYVERGDLNKLRTRLEADAKSLHALYEYARLHGCVRLVWGRIDERLPVPWVHFHEPTFGTMKRKALELGIPLEIVHGGAPAFDAPWAQAGRVRVIQGLNRWDLWLEDEHGFILSDGLVQRARMSVSLH